jgi:hypothetical protein
LEENWTSALRLEIRRNETDNLAVSQTNKFK